MSVHDYKSLRVHAGHKIVCVVYGEEHNVSIECQDCNEVLLDFENEDDYILSDKSRLVDRNRIVLDTYAKDDDSSLDHVSFSVPLPWLARIVRDEFNMSVDDFLADYIWDDGELIMSWADADNVLEMIEEE